MKPLTVPEALEVILAHVPPPRLDTLPLLEAAGHVLAEDVLADRDLPPWDKSLMDGFAARSEEVAVAPVDLEVVEEVPAGRVGARAVAPGQAVRIMTGAPVPAGADCVVNLERTVPLAGGKRVRVNQGVGAGAHLARRGDEGRAGERLIAAGATVRAQEIAVLASVGRSEVQVHRRPTCSVLATGDELVEVERMPLGAQIRNSNAWMLCAQAMAARLTFAYLGIVRDDREQIRQRLRTAVRADVVLTSGGVSVGDLDLVKECLAAEGAEILFDGVKIKPGKPITFARKGDTRIFALPGNPAGAFVGFEVFVRPFAAAFARDPGLERPLVRARLLRPLKRSSDRTQFVPARATAAPDGWTVDPVPWHGSGDVAGLSRCSALAVVHPDGPGLDAGATVDTLLLDRP